MRKWTKTAGLLFLAAASVYSYRVIEAASGSKGTEQASATVAVAAWPVRIRAERAAPRTTGAPDVTPELDSPTGFAGFGADVDWVDDELGAVVEDELPHAPLARSATISQVSPGRMSASVLHWCRTRAVRATRKHLGESVYSPAI